jgi:lipoprotein-anchoring transpeptidase ErfK/SrfK
MMVTSRRSRTLVYAVALALAWVSGGGGLAHAAQQETAVPVWSTGPGRTAPAVRQRDGFWVAAVAWPAANVHAKPNAGSDIRRVAQEGDLLHVAGRQAGIDGDAGSWWATTDGYVAEGSIQPTSGEWAESWRLPDASEASNGFWVEVTSQASVRAGPTLSAPAVGTLEPGARVKVLSEEQDPDGDPTPWYRIDGGRYAGARLYSGRTTRLPAPQPNTTPPAEGATGRWIVVDRQAATLTLVSDGQPELATFVSLGRAGVDTPSGQYRVVNRLPLDDMRSDLNPTADRSYALPNVPHVQYFTDAGDALHGTYWHDKFGTLESQGCINLTMTDAAFVFGRSEPATPLVILD